MKIKPRFRRIARRGGGVSFGITLHFPVSICETIQELEGTEEEHWQRVTISLLLVAFVVHLDFDYDFTRDARCLEFEKGGAK